MPLQFTDSASGSLVDSEPPDIPGVRFRLIEGFPGYAVGDDGSVWSRVKIVGLGYGRGTTSKLVNRWRRMKTPGSRYANVVLYNNGKRSQRHVHTLVLNAFVGPCPEGMVACHFPDWDGHNNSLKNLKWGTHKENSSHKVPQGTSLQGSQIRNSRLKEQDIPKIFEMFNAWASYYEIAKTFRVSTRTIQAVIFGETWSHVPHAPKSRSGRGPAYQH